MPMSSSGVMLSAAGRAGRHHPEERPEGPRLEGWGGLMLRDAALRAAPQHEAEETSSLGPLAYHDVYRGPVGGCDRRRVASRRSEPKSPRMSASFFARDQPLTCRSAAMASVMRSNHWENTRVTGRRCAV